MPKCINDLQSYYTGNEHSPKGLGFCAHTEKIGTIKKGKDGNIWIVKKNKSGSHRWIKKNNDKVILEKSNKKFDNKFDCSKFVHYVKTEKKLFGTSFFKLEYKKIKHSIMGLELKKGFINKFINFNTFEDEPTKLPEGYKKKKIENNFIKKYYCDSSKEILTKKRLTKNIIKINHPNSKNYFILDNGENPFLVYISKNKVNIYTYPIKNENKYFVADKDQNKKWTYINKIATYKNPIKVFIGESPENEITKFSGGIKKEFVGNSILLQIGKDSYVFIGRIIYEFSTNDDQIIEYYSPVGNIDVPYPVAIGEKNIYFMLDLKYVPIDKFHNFNNIIKSEAYLYYFQLSKYSKKMIKTKIIKQSSRMARLSRFIWGR
jgi:hypothetical protein